MEWIEAAIATKSEEIELLCSRLDDLGIEGVSIEDEADFRDFLENNHQYWDYVDKELEDRFAGLSRVKFYVEDSKEGCAKLDEIRAALGVEISCKCIADADWENNWRDYYQPLKIGEKLIVVPEWLDADLEGRLPIRLDPGLIFGTGSHATTRMCLHRLEKYMKPDGHVLDLGCGSGILGIGAMVLGARDVTGCDIDPKAPDVAKANARLNGINTTYFSIFEGNILEDESLRVFFSTGYDTVLANIVSDVIIPMSNFVTRFMKPGSYFICSGIIDGREDAVRAALERNDLEIVEHVHEEEWHCFVCYWEGKDYWND